MANQVKITEAPTGAWSIVGNIVPVLIHKVTGEEYIFTSFKHKEDADAAGAIHTKVTMFQTGSDSWDHKGVQGYVPIENYSYEVIE